MTYETEAFHVVARLAGEGIVWAETIPAAEVGAIFDALRSNDPGRNVLAENGYDLATLTIECAAVPLSDFDKLCQDAKREAAALADAETAEAAERAERAMRNRQKQDAALKAAGVEFDPRPDERFVTVYAAGRIIGTAQRARVGSNEPAWTFYTTDGAKRFAGRTLYTFKAELLRSQTRRA